VRALPLVVLLPLVSAGAVVLDRLRSVQTIDLGALEGPASLRIVMAGRLTTITGDLACGDTGEVSLVGLPSLRSVPPLGLVTATDIVVLGTGLLDLDLLSGLTSATSLTIEGNTQLRSLSGLAVLETVEGDVLIRTNREIAVPPRLSMTGALDALREVGGFLMIERNALVSLDTLGALETVGGRFVVDESRLTEISGIDSLVSVGDELDWELAQGRVEGPATLRTVGSLYLSGDEIVGFAGLEAIANEGRIRSWGPLLMPALERAGSLQIYGGAATTSLSFPVLTEPGHLTLRNLGVLESLAGLEAVRTVDALVIKFNDALTDVIALHGIEAVTGALIVIDNDVLPTGAAEALRDAIGAGAIQGDVTIDGNAP
jgi:hypothetical protein